MPAFCRFRYEPLVVELVEHGAEGGGSHAATGAEVVGSRGALGVAQGIEDAVAVGRRREGQGVSVVVMVVARDEGDGGGAGV